MTKQELHAAIAAGAIAAFDCLKRGETHPRANQMMTRTAARNAAFYPPCPPDLRPVERQPFTQQEIDIGAWYDNMTGRFGHQRSD